MTERVFVTRRLPDDAADLLAAEGVEMIVGQEDDESGLSRDALLDGVRGADVVLSLLTESIDREVLTANPRLRGVANFAVGFDNIDIATATSLGIPVSNTPGVLTEATADFTWAMLLAVTRRIPEAHQYTVDGRFQIWGPNLLLGTDIGTDVGTGIGSDDPATRKTLGIIGFGAIGQAVARRATGFGLRILATSPRGRAAIEATPGVEWADFPTLLRDSDFVTLHAPLTEETHHLIGRAEFREMKPDAYFVNAARGPIVDEVALVEALRDGQIAGAALDVYENEPALTPGLADLQNVVLFPHIASATHETRGRMAATAARNAVAHLRGEPAPNPVNAEVYRSDAYRQRVAPS